MNLRGSIWQVLDLTTPTIIIALAVFISLRCVNYLNNDDELIFHREIFYASFIIYILCLFNVVTAGEINSIYSEGFNLIPFKEILRYKVGTHLFITNVIGNIMIFIPYGFFINYFTKNKKLWVSIILGIFLSGTIEITQYFIGRIFDIDDILLNSIGMLIGFIFYKSGCKFLDKSKKKDMILNIFSVIILILYIIFLVWWS